MICAGPDFSANTLERRRALLREGSILSGLPPAVLDDLCRRMQTRTRPAGTLLVAQGEVADGIHFIAAGRVRLVLVGDNGREVTVGELRPGEFFGESAVLDAATQSTDVVAVDAVTLLMLTRDAFLAHLQQHPATAIRLATELARRLGAANGTIAEMALDSVESRLVRTLVRLAQAESEATERGLLLRCRPTHQELANRVGTCRETITRMIASLCRRGLLVSRGARLMLTPALVERAAASAA